MPEFAPGMPAPRSQSTSTSVTPFSCAALRTWINFFQTFEISQGTAQLHRLVQQIEKFVDTDLSISIAVKLCREPLCVVGRTVWKEHAQHPGEFLSAKPAIAVCIEQIKEVSQYLLCAQLGLVSCPSQKIITIDGALVSDQSPEGVCFRPRNDGGHRGQHVLDFSRCDRPITIDVKQRIKRGELARQQRLACHGDGALELRD